MNISQNLILAAVMTILPAVATADEMTLTTMDNKVSISGDYVGFQQNAYVIMYRGQELFVPALLMRCDGTDCLHIERVEAVVAPSTAGS